MTQGFPSRRETLAGLSVSTLALGSHPAVAAQAKPDPVFRHGVASGDPDATSLVLWTRVTAREPVEVEWELAHDAAFRRTIQAGKKNCYLGYSAASHVSLSHFLSFDFLIGL